MMRFDKKVLACLAFWLALWLAWGMFMVTQVAPALAA